MIHEIEKKEKENSTIS